MSTRGVIAHLDVRGENVPGFSGTYNHYDSYPEWMGPTLWKLLEERGLPAVAALIDAHPGGWRHFGRECYCHDKELDDQDMRMTEAEADPLFMEWCWVLHETGFLILKGAWRAHCFLVLCNVDLAKPQPDWLAISQIVRGYQDPSSDARIDGVLDYGIEIDEPPARLCVMERGALKPWRFGEPCSIDLLGDEIGQVVLGLGG